MARSAPPPPPPPPTEGGSYLLDGGELKCIQRTEMPGQVSSEPLSASVEASPAASHAAPASPPED